MDHQRPSNGRPLLDRGIGALSIVLAMSFLAAGCDDESTPLATPDPICDRFEVVRSVDYASGQFFRLTAPAPFYFADPDSFPEPLQDESLQWVRSEQNPYAPWRIDYASLEVYRTMGPGSRSRGPSMVPSPTSIRPA